MSHYTDESIEKAKQAARLVRINLLLDIEEKVYEVYDTHIPPCDESPEIILFDHIKGTLDVLLEGYGQDYYEAIQKRSPCSA